MPRIGRWEGGQGLDPIRPGVPVTMGVRRVPGIPRGLMRCGCVFQGWKALDESFPTVQNSAETEFWGPSSRAPRNRRCPMFFSAEMEFPGAKLQKKNIPKGDAYYSEIIDILLVSYTIN